MKRHIRQQYSKKYSFIRLETNTPIMLSIIKISQHWNDCGGYNDQPYFGHYYGSDTIMSEFLLTYTEPLTIAFIEVK